MYKTCFIHFYAEAAIPLVPKRNDSAEVIPVPEGEMDIVLNCSLADPPSSTGQPHHWYHHNKWLYASDNPMALVENSQLLERWKDEYSFSHITYSTYSVSYLTITQGMLFHFDYGPHCTHTQNWYFSTHERICLEYEYETPE